MARRSDYGGQRKLAKCARGGATNLLAGLPVSEWSECSMSKKKHPCPVCGHLTIDEPCNWNTCPVCCWEDDMVASSGADWEKSPANLGMRVSEAQANYRLFGVVHLPCLDAVRAPRPDEIPETPFEIWPQAEELVESLGRQSQHDILPGHSREKIERLVIPYSVRALGMRSRTVRRRAIRILIAIADLPEDARVALSQALTGNSRVD